MTNQPEALRLSETLLDYELSQDYVIATIEAAAELRRLHEVNQILIDELTEVLSWQSLAPEHVVISAKAALAKAELAKPEQDHGFDRTASHMAGEYVGTAEQDQLAHDQITHGMSMTLDGKRVDPASIYKEPEQEPVAHMYPSTLKDFEYGEKADYAYSIEMGNIKTGEKTVPLYTSPLRKEWVGLTDEEMEQTCYETFSLDPYEISRAIEAKLRSKNER